MTKLNNEILKLLQNSPEHLTAEDTYLLARNNGIKVSIASVYRILGKLSEEGHIRKVSVPDGPDVFDHTLKDHAHLVCTQCGAVTDLEVPRLRSCIEKAAGVPVSSFELCVRALCPNCINNTEKETSK